MIKFNNNFHYICFMLGDSKGTDTLVQQYLNFCKYKDVTIITDEDKAKNCMNSKWKIVRLRFSENDNTKLLSQKDKYMTQLCDFGLFIWDGKSKETKDNMYRLAYCNRPYYIFKIQNDKYSYIEKEAGEYYELP